MADIVNMDVAKLFKALSDGSRLRIVLSLAKGSFNVQELTSILALSQSTVSHHLKILDQAGLVESKKEGTWAYYRLKEAHEDELQVELISLLRKHTEHPTDGNASADDTVLREDQAKLEDILRARRDRTRSFFDSVASSWSSLREEIPGANYPIESLLTELGTEEILLDLGCGSGVLLEKILPRTGTTLAVDYSEAMLQEARKNLGSLSEDVDFRLGYLEHLPLGDNTVDVAVGFMVFHHIAEPLSALRDVCRVLRPGGKLIIGDLTVHDKEYMREQFADLWLGFDRDEFTKWVKKAGFQDVRIDSERSQKDVFLLTAKK